VISEETLRLIEKRAQREIVIKKFILGRAFSYFAFNEKKCGERMVVEEFKIRFLKKFLRI
jgi:hypothetical protein